MASLPTPRSLSQIIGRMADIFLSRFGAKGLKPGSPIVGFIEAAAQSDARSAQDIFTLLEAQDDDRATGETLDRRMESAGIRRRGETRSTGTVTVSDTSFTKLVAKVWQGAPAPIAGSTFIYVTGADAFTASGEVYLGRGTTSYEGPIPYTRVAHVSGVWRLDLDSPTKRYHPVGEGVVLAQGGNREVPAGTVVTTPQGNVSEAVEFKATRTVTLLDGEDILTDVPVQCQKTGVVGNVPAGAISVVPSPAFVGMAVENLSAISNALPREDDATARSRLRKHRQAKKGGTVLAIETGSYGIAAADEASAVLSARVIERRLAPTTLYIDDGSGYEEKTSGIALEVLVDEAQGGEDKFQLTYGRPVAKAFVKTGFTAPYNLIPGSALAVRVGGVLSVHGFDAADFDDIRAASAYEVVSSINANSDLLFAARVSQSGVSIFAKSEANDDIEVVSLAGLVDANGALDFPLGRVDTLRLYRNDVSLYKDGLKARVDTNAVSKWAGLISPETFTIAVDGTEERTYTLRDIDFVPTGYTDVSETNSLEAWAAVLNAKVPGITASVTGQGLTITSNLGADSRASIVINPLSSLVTKGMFALDALEASGKSSDFILDRNLGQVELVKTLSKGDRLTAGSYFTRAYLESGKFTSINVAGVSLWLTVDGDTSIVQTGLSSAHKLQVTLTAGSTIKRFASLDGDDNSVSLFRSLRKGDWLVLWDTAFAGDVAFLKNTLRVSYVDPEGAFFEVDEATIPAGSVNIISGLTSSAIVFVRTSSVIQKVDVDGSFTADTLAEYLNTKLAGATAVAHDTNWVRIMTNSFAGGDIALITQTANSMGFPSKVVQSELSHIAAIESSVAEGELPAFVFTEVSAAAGNDLTTREGALTALQNAPNQWVGRWMRPLSSVGFENRYDGLAGSISALRVGGASLKAGSLVTTPEAYAAGRHGSLLSLAHAYGLTAYDTLDVLLDKDETSKLFAVDLFRKTTTEGAYGTTIRLNDTDSGQPLLGVFGADFDFRDFAVHMQPRVKLADDATSVLFRLQQFGPAAARVRYVRQSTPDQSVGVSYAAGDTFDISIKLKSGAQVTPLAANSKVLYGTVGGHVIVQAGFPITACVRAANVTTVTTSLSAGLTDHGIQTGDTVWIESLDGGFGGGAKTATRISASQFSYADPGAGGAIGSIGNMTVWLNSEMGNSLQNIVTGHTLVLGSSFPAAIQGAWGITDKSAIRLALTSTEALATGRVVMVAAEDFFSFPNTTTTAEIVTALADNSAVRAVELAAGTITAPDETWASFADGLNYVNSAAVVTGNFNFTLKLPVAAGLSAPNDWANEKVRLVPTTTKNIVDFMSASSVTPLAAAGAAVVASRDGRRVQIASGVIGSGGAVQVKGGTANESSAVMLNGSPTQTPTYALLNVRAQDALQFLVSPYVVIENALVAPKVINHSSITIVGNKVTIPTSRVGGTASGGKWNVEKHGPYACYISSNDNAAAPGFNFSDYAGDWVTISSGPSPQNCGTFRIVNVVWDAGKARYALWVENSNAVAETASGFDVDFFRYNSVMPGDVLSIGTDALGVSNQGSFTVTAHEPGDSNSFRVDSVLTDFAVAPYSEYVTVTGAQVRVFKKVAFVHPHPTYSGQWVVALADKKFVEQMSSNYGTSVAALMKLGFETSGVVGTDGYAHNTGLIAAVNKVVQGDERDTQTYPGIACASAIVNISGPIVKRVKMSLDVRSRIGSTIKPAVQAAVAKAVNDTPFGVPVAISAVVAAVQGVSGVEAVTVLSPTYKQGNDSVPVQPYEKAMVINPSTDITVNIVGQ